MKKTMTLGLLTITALLSVLSYQQSTVRSFLGQATGEEKMLSIDINDFKSGTGYVGDSTYETSIDYATRWNSQLSSTCEFPVATYTAKFQTSDTYDYSSLRVGPTHRRIMVQFPVGTIITGYSGRFARYNHDNVALHFSKTNYTFTSQSNEDQKYDRVDTSNVIGVGATGTQFTVNKTLLPTPYTLSQPSTPNPNFGADLAFRINTSQQLYIHELTLYYILP